MTDVTHPATSAVHPVVTVLTVVRLIPLPVHAALRLSSALATIVIGLLAGFETTGLVLAVAFGAVTAGIALGGLPDERGRAAIGVSTLHALDYGLALGLLVAGLAVSLAGDAPAGAILCAIAVVQLGGNALTRYSTRG